VPDVEVSRESRTCALAIIPESSDTDFSLP
jgi:hypothetical protein